MSKVILIEDDEDNLFLFKEALEDCFQEMDILAYDNFSEARESFDHHSHEVILIVADHKVQIETSDTFFEYVQKKNDKIPFIVVSAGIPDSSEYLKKIRNSQRHCFWQKPVAVQEINEYIKFILDKNG